MKEFRLIEFCNANGVKYRIYFRKVTKKDLKGARAKEAYGVCFSPDSKQPKIIIDPALNPEKELRVLIEEYYHSENFDHSEKKARHFARVLAELIILLGWKKNEDKTKKRKDK